MSNEFKFQHEAMNTTFSFRIVHEDEKEARSAFSSAIELIEKLENLLSRYIPGSDVWQLNHMQAGQSLFIDDHTYACLRQAVEMHSLSGGLFDISLGRQIEHLKSQTDAPAPGIEGSLNIDPDKPAVHCLEPGREVDLGGIGKGYALDCIAKEMFEWNIQCALISSGASTHLAFGDKSWQIQLVGALTERTINLQNMALSVSGADVQGTHIVSPADTSNAAPNGPKLWVLHPKASYADAWSTACFLMDDQQLDQISDQLSIIKDC
jgi:thiamine biosynthesis lipoprotein